MSFSINPHQGYLNTNFQLSNNTSSELEITCVQLGCVWRLAPNQVINDIHVQSAGTFEFSCKSDGEVQSIEVIDAIRLGGSYFRQSFAFDNNPWFMLSMNDRTYFYNRETKEQYFENSIAPEKVIGLNQEYLLFTTAKESTCGALYSTTKRKIIRYVQDVVAYNELYMVLKDANGIEIISLSSQIADYSIPIEEIRYAYYSEIHSIAYLDAEEVCVIYDIISQKKRFFDANSSNFKACLFLDAPYLAKIDTFSIVLVSLVTFQSKFISVAQSSPIIDFNGTSLTHNGESSIDYFKHFREQNPAVNSVMSVVLRCHRNAIYLEKSYYDYKFRKLNNGTLSEWWDKGKHTLEEPRGTGVVLADFYNESPVFYCTDEYFVAATQNSMALISDSNIIVKRGVKYFQINGVGFYYTQNDEETIIYSENGTYLCSTKLNGNESNIQRGLVQKDGNWYDFTRGVTIRHREYTVMPESKSILFYDNDNVCYIYADGHCRLLEANVNDVYNIINSCDVVYIKKGSQCSISRYNIIKGYYDTSPIVFTNFDSSHYKNALFTDMEDVILCKEGHEYVFYNIKEGTKDIFDNTNFVIRGINGYLPLVSFDKYRCPVLKDPITLSFITPDLFSAEYAFVSPFGRYRTVPKRMFRNKATNRIVNIKEKSNFLDSYRRGKDNIDNRRKFFEEHESLFDSYLESYVRDGHREAGVEYICKEMNDDCFAEHIFNEIITIYDAKTQKNIEIETSGFFWYMNYISFSYDERYVAIAGRYPDNCGIGGFFGLYDLENQQLINSKKGIYAVWITAFTKEGKVAYYTSDPDTYICNPAQLDKVQQIENRNFLCYSVDGKYMALSNQGYIRYSNHTNDYSKLWNDENCKIWGHQKSTTVYIYDAETLTHIKTIKCLFGDKISGSAFKNSSVRAGNVAYVAFSQDNKSILISSEDGVVLKYNLHL